MPGAAGRARILREAVVAAALVAVVTAFTRAVGGDLTTAAMLLVGTVVVAGLVGTVAVVTDAVLAFFALNLFFTPPLGSLSISRSDDAVALAVFVTVAALVGWSVNRLDTLRRRAERRESETALRLDLADQVADGADDVVGFAADAIRRVFALSGCVVVYRGERGSSGSLDATHRFHVDLEHLDLDAAATHALDDDGPALRAVAGELATALDRAALLEEVRDARIATAVSRQRAGFISAVSHNLRTPLTSIKAAASALLSSWSRIDTAERRELLETVYDESERLERLVRNTLEITRIRAGALEPHPQDVDIGDIVRLAVRRLQPIARKHLIRLAVADGLVDVRLDVTMTEQILLNLLENALRFAPPGSEILVSAAPVDDHDWELRVVDHGPGVPEDHREDIFEEFVSVDDRPERTGTGLGLAIARALVTAQHGALWYEETPGGGATFVGRFPRGAR